MVRHHTLMVQSVVPSQEDPDMLIISGLVVGARGEHYIQLLASSEDFSKELAVISRLAPGPIVRAQATQENRALGISVVPY